ncbi:putative type I restriction enzyme BthVORF4518P M protein [Pedobacter sp. Bi27]|uniref:HsdM family class I SAM-dependent methyltransferase n=1 Tax=Pedobacter sp. Bi27 TaxID=2822351 RepID=UPI001E025B1C|nr:class I SAM-dependent DNA methyltransferase [Pedobacter sp. Bi27]CAH0137736.1 putative type I restriction enzyme BthVORF4518P M protein [Pedobacter sp. Bi27]
MTERTFLAKTKELINSLKSVCTNYGLGNDGNEYKIITQIFLYKYINDKFAYEVKKINKKLSEAENFQKCFEGFADEELSFLFGRLGNKVPKLYPYQTITYLHDRQNKDNYQDIFDGTLEQISNNNSSKFSIRTSNGARDKMFDKLSSFILDEGDKPNFCRALISKIVDVSFEPMFGEKYDFFASIFEYLIKDYNSDSGGTYAEYYTPHAVARIMASILVDEKIPSAKCYDPSAGSGTLLMNIAHTLGERNCTIYSEDISQKSSNMLRLNLILNDLGHSISNVVKGNTILEPFYREEKFDYIVSNPPFKLDFSDFSATLDTDINKKRFFAGIPNIPKNKKDSMAIYLLFIQHIMYSLSEKGKAAIVVPTGFITAQSGVERKIREAMIERKLLRGVVSMPSNIFASTGTNVSVLFLDKKANAEHIVLVDASKLGNTIKEGKNQRTVLTLTEEQRIIDAMNNKIPENNFSVVVATEKIKAKNYSFSAGQYFEVKIDYVDITAEEFKEKMTVFESKIESLFKQGNLLEIQIQNSLKSLSYG